MRKTKTAAMAACITTATGLMMGLPSYAATESTSLATIGESVERSVSLHLDTVTRGAVLVAQELDQAEDILTGTAKDGSPVEVIIQREPNIPTDLPLERNNLDYGDVSDASSEAPGPQTGRVETEPFPAGTGWALSAITTITSNSVSVYWPTAGEFTGEIFSSASTMRATPRYASGESITFSNLDEDTVYEISLSAPDGTERITRAETFPRGKDAQSRLVSPLAYQPYYQSYIHKTFIAEHRINVGAACPDQAVNQYSFGGDTRGYRYPASNEPYATPDYRTMMFLNINWDNPAPYDLIWVKNVGQTTVWNSNGTLAGSAYTGMGGMTFSGLYSNGSMARGLLDHEANDPLCTILGIQHAPPIDYSEWVTFYRSGTTQVAGARRPVPMHEMYAKFTSASGMSEYWSTLTRRPNDGFHCLLVPLCPISDTYDVSVSS